jgi:BirA family biotin operon repressor/biotin-[acetyl-CoA-carboxylase] ligase
MPKGTAMPATIAAIASALGPLARRFDVDVLDTCASTNAELLARAEAGAASGTVLVANEQTAGRGRRGRSWIASPGDSLTFSLLWRFAPGTAPAGLSLAVGLAVARALQKVGAGDTALKWPNDILRNRRKLGGILIELVPGAPHAAVIGIGLNLHLPAAMPAELRAVSAALCEPGGAADEDALYAMLLGELLAVLEGFAASGFAPLRDEWMARNAYADTDVVLLSDFGAARSGICRGVDTDGALLFDADGRVERILSGEVSLRPA